MKFVVQNKQGYVEVLKSNMFRCFDSVDTAGPHQAKKLMIVLYASPSKQGAGFKQL